MRFAGFEHIALKTTSPQPELVVPHRASTAAHAIVPCRSPGQEDSFVWAAWIWKTSL
jgi:hypothetical protein